MANPLEVADLSLLSPTRLSDRVPEDLVSSGADAHPERAVVLDPTRQGAYQ